MQSLDIRRSALCALAWIAVLCLPPSGIAVAGWTDPSLLLTDVRAVRGSSRVYVQLTGSFHEEDLVQIPYPIQVLIRQVATGNEYVRYSLAIDNFVGTHPGLSDGVDTTEALELLTLGTPSNGDLQRIANGRIRLILPDPFPTGTSEALLFVVADDGDVILSNPIVFEIPAGGV